MDESLRTKIAAAWRDAPRPDDDELLHDPSCRREECVRLGRYFQGRRWEEVRAADLIAACGADALGLLSPVAFRYHLGAFLLAVLDDRERGGLRAHVLYLLCPHEGWRERIDGLGDEKLAAVLAVLLRFAEREEVARAIPIWERRLARPVAE